MENIYFSGKKVQRERRPDERENRGRGGLSIGRAEGGSLREGKVLEREVECKEGLREEETRGRMT